jgi:hypothetical protein
VLSALPEWAHLGSNQGEPKTTPSDRGPQSSVLQGKDAPCNRVKTHCGQPETALGVAKVWPTGGALRPQGERSPVPGAMTLRIPLLRSKFQPGPASSEQGGTVPTQLGGGGAAFPPVRRCPEDVRGNDPELASYLRIEERELEAGGLN